MFNANDPADLAALKSEQATDPIGMGYAAVSGTRDTLNLFNLSENNVGLESTGEPFTPDLALDVIEPVEVTVGAKFTEGQANWLNYLMAAADSVLDFAAFEAKFRALFSSYTPSSVTLTALDARTRRLSRAEVLFGEDTVISKSDWFAARDS